MLKKILPVFVALALLSNVDAAPLDDARTDLEAGNWRRASIALKGILQDDPSATEALLLLARIQLLQRNGAAAQKSLERAIAQGIPEDQVLTPLARSLIHQGKADRVLEMIGPLDQAPPQRRAELLALSGLAKLSTNHLSEAEAELNQSHELAPDGALARFGLAQIAVREEDWDKARTLVQGHLDEHPESIEGWEMLAGVELAAGQPNAALQALGNLLRRAPQSASARLLRAQLLLDRNQQTDIVEKDIKALRSLVPRAPALALLQGRLALSQGEIEQGTQMIEQFLQASPSHPLALYFASVGHYHQRHLSQAKEYAERLQAAAPSSAQANALVAAIALADGDTERAAQILSGLPKDSGLALVEELRLRIAVAKGDLAEALRILDQRIVHGDASEPAHWQNRLMRLRILGASDDWESVRREAESMAAEQPDDALLAKMRLEAMLRTGDTKGAVAAARARTVQAPEDADAYSVLAKVLARSGDVEGSRKAFNTALQLDPSQADAAMGLAGLEARSGNLAAAREPLLALAETSPDSLGAVMGLATLDLAEGRQSDAETRLQAALQREPGNLKLRLNLAAVRTQQGDKAGALQVLQEATPEQHRSPALLRARGALQLNTGQPAQAVETFRALREQRPDAAEPALMLALSKARAGQLMGIETLVIDAVQMADDSSPLVAAAIDSVYASLQDDAQRERLIERLGNAVPSNLSYRLLAANMALKQQDRTAAIAHLRAAYSVAPHEFPILERLVGLLSSEGKLDPARAMLQGFVTDHPDDAKARTLLATVELQTGNQDAAVTEYRKVLEIDPKQPEALNNLAMLTMDDDLDGALTMAREAAALKPSDWRIVDTLAITLIRKGLEQEAAERLGRARVEHPNNPTLAYRLAVALAKTGESQQAQKLLLLIGERQFPESAEAKALLSRLQAESGVR